MRFTFKRKPGSQELPGIADTEWTVMKVLWRLGVASAKQVVEALEGQTHWKPKTIHTLINRLVQKGMLVQEKPERVYLFRPALTEQECRSAVSRSFLDKVFDGKIAPFLACFLKREKLTRKEIEELKRILEGKEQ